ncbi:hypothetical protein A2661_01825 [Candidatus Giovannonibacteria bacterium RIFCSPHIGHO2_01_FULL_45_24]|uniref:CbiN domain protein n=1 Tax=Candidatus Giovannonibacteria bacterium RIFCSPLOWO2_01_FULL_46_32 TaxID=1798353 RepID=A0A1F5XIJ5_9BACT|nr:MAG: hypothetical protein A2661_01825 [Candidatus Giovannonibacteria bacterium RIFCSPHIGHO2_01_FULL_45_24]OGF87301.1 MAG: hypothetical protein A3B19_03700 [Candidatus Giovannonibacteria bacterium RIFCSPLOWO2_01_FULL_46_32]
MNKGISVVWLIVDRNYFMTSKIQKIFPVIIVVFLSLYSLGRPLSAFAYQCEQSKSFVEDFEQSSAVFVGEITQIVKIEPVGTPEGGPSVRFEVNRTYKGNLEKTVDIRVDGIGGLGYGFCDVHLKEGETYLVYASGNPLSTNICTRGIGSCNRTRLLKYASEDLAILTGEATTPMPVEDREEVGSPEPKTSLLSTEALIIGSAMLIIGIFIGRTFGGKIKSEHQ